MVPVQDRGTLRFVVHEHFSKHHHFDFRLERDGVLKSWAVPKGLPERDGERRLAIAVEDHPLDYIGFSGVISEGEYGAGKVTVADSGTYIPVIWEEKKIEIFLSGNRFTGTYVLVPFAKAGADQYLIIKTSSRTVPPDSRIHS